MPRSFTRKQRYARREPWVLGPGWPEPLVESAPLRLASAVVEHALHIDLADPRRTLPVFQWLLTVLPEEGPVCRRNYLPDAIATVERVLRDEVNVNAKRHGRKLKPEHRTVLADLVRRHRDPVKHD